MCAVVCELMLLIALSIPIKRFLIGWSKLKAQEGPVRDRKPRILQNS